MLSVLVVTEVVSIVSEKVKETFDVIETEVSPSEGELDDTVGDVVSVDVEVSEEVEDELSLDEELLSSLPHEIMVRPNRNMEKMMSKCLIDFLIG